jgi:hypothetical protein
MTEVWIVAEGHYRRVEAVFATVSAAQAYVEKEWLDSQPQIDSAVFSWGGNHTGDAFTFEEYEVRRWEVRP